MRGFLCCFKGGTNQVNQEPPEPPEPPEPSDVAEPTDSSECIIELPLGDNDIQLPDDHYSPDSSPDLYPSPLSEAGVKFRWQEILEGTDNFRLTNFLGEGKFGKVYRCDLPRINKVGAAKIQDPEKPCFHPPYVAETTTLHSANHPNVIKLLGQCFSRENRAIVYEFLPKGSIDNHLFAHTSPSPGLQQESLSLDWDRRMSIAVGVAEALIYLHEELKIVHGDVKASNVLLDECYVPKLSDFGLATKIVLDEDGEEQQSVIIQDMETQECIAPETDDSCLVSTKSDVYSYGVFLSTLFTGRKAYDPEKPFQTRKITDWLMPVWSASANIPLVIDVTLGKRFSVDGIIRLFLTARMCIHPNAYERPDMDFVASMVREAAAYPVPELPPVTESCSM